MTHIEQRADTTAGWASANPVLYENEVGWEIDGSHRCKLGDGVTAWNDLDYANGFVFDPADWDLDQVDNTSDDDKPISAATEEALNFKASLNSPVFTGNPLAPTPTPGDEDESIATTKFVQDAIAAALADPEFAGGVVDSAVEAGIAAAALTQNPVGAIKMTTLNVNPSGYLGGTWVAWGSGRVPVGVDAAQTEFTPAEKTGGAKTVTLTANQMPKHRHTIRTWGRAIAGALDAGAVFVRHTGSGATATYDIDSTYAGNSEAHNNLQPYVTCYMWKRTA